MRNNLSAFLKDIEKNKKIDKSVVIETLRNSIATVCGKNFGQDLSIDVKINETDGSIGVFFSKKVVEYAEKENEISLEDAKKINPNVDIGDVVEIKTNLDGIGRISVQAVKKLMLKKLYDSQQEVLLEEFSEYIQHNVQGIVRNVDGDNILIEIDGYTTLLATAGKSPSDEYRVGKSYKFYVTDVSACNRGVNFLISRKHPNLIREMLIEEVPEIKDGTVKIINIVREPGIKTKVSVSSELSNVDPIGSCLGVDAARIKNITNELNGENIDIVSYSDDLEQYTKNCLKPARVTEVTFDENNGVLYVKVPKDQLSLAIGAKGINVKLASKLIRHKISLSSDF